MTKPMSNAFATAGAFVPPPLSQGEAHVWHTDLVNLGAVDRNWAHLLSTEEQQRASRFRFSRDRERFAAARAWLRVLLGSYLNVAPGTLNFSYTEHGKPSLNGLHAPEDLHFNISHSDQVVLFGVTLGHAIGVDVERVRYDFEVVSIARRFFSTAEQKAFSALPGTQHHHAFFDCWTRKEAYVKAVGEGLSHPLHQFDVSLSPGTSTGLLSTRPDPDEVKHWTLAAVDIDPGYSAAVAVRAAGITIHCREFPQLA